MLGALEAAAQLGFAPIKINVVIIRGYNDDEILDLADYFRGTGHILRFIEYMAVGQANSWREELVIPNSEVLNRIHAYFPLEPLSSKRFGEPAKRYRYRDGPGGNRVYIGNFPTFLRKVYSVTPYR